MDRKTFLKKGIFSLGEMLLRPGRFMAEQADQAFLRPPGFAGEMVGLCHGCDRCLAACPGGALMKREGVAGPVLEPARGGCRFCYLCVGACPHQVLTFPKPGERVRLGLAIPDNDHCLAQRGGCFTCLEQCPRQAIAIEQGTGIGVNPESCDGCGLCEHACLLSPAAVRVRPLTPQ